MTAMRAPVLQTRGQGAQSLFQRAQLVVHFHAQGLENLRGRMPAAVPPDDLLDRARQLHRFAEWLGLALLHQLAGDPSRRRFFAEIAKQMRQLFLAVAIDHIRRG